MKYTWSPKEKVVSYNLHIVYSVQHQHQQKSIVMY